MNSVTHSCEFIIVSLFCILLYFVSMMWHIWLTSASLTQYQRILTQRMRWHLLWCSSMALEHPRCSYLIVVLGSRSVLLTSILTWHVPLCSSLFFNMCPYIITFLLWNMHHLPLWREFPPETEPCALHARPCTCPT